MRTYFWTSVQCSASGVEIWSTSTKVLDWITDELKKLIPGCQTKTSKDLGNELYYLRLTYLRNRDYDVGYWIIRNLCQQGWEPLGSNEFKFEATVPL